jgi:prephenate dehydrogenase
MRGVSRSSGRHARERDVERVEALALACGARPLTMDAAAHDAATAAISHAPLVVAAALVEAMAGAPGSGVPEGWDDARRIAASGWRDMTRLARGDAEMGAGILATNGPATADHLRAVRARLDAWIATLEAEGGGDAGAIRRALAADRARIAETDPDRA